jgi:hypothetical protein
MAKTRTQIPHENRVEIFLLAGLDCNAAQFRLYENTLKTDCLPVPCLILPTDLFDDEEVDLAEKFKVLLDAQMSAGNWEKRVKPTIRRFIFGVGMKIRKHGRI